MRFLRTFLAFLLVGAYLFGACHCQLEKIPGLEIFACQEENGPCGDASDCADMCSTLEAGHYRAQSLEPVCPIPVDLVLIEMEPVQLVLPSESSNFRVEFEVPYLEHSWQFRFRTALPVRSPSPV